MKKITLFASFALLFCFGQQAKAQRTASARQAAPAPSRQTAPPKQAPVQRTQRQSAQRGPAVQQYKSRSQQPSRDSRRSSNPENRNQNSGRRNGSQRWCRDGRGRHLLIYNSGWGYWYYGAWYPYSYAYSPYPYYQMEYTGVSGLKFDLGTIPVNDREFVKESVVYVDGSEVGSVKNFEGHFRKLSLEPGSHEVNVVLPDGRELNTTISVQFGNVTHINLRSDRFSDPQQDSPPPAESK